MNSAATSLFFVFALGLHSFLGHASDKSNLELLDPSEEIIFEIPLHLKNSEIQPFVSDLFTALSGIDLIEQGSFPFFNEGYVHSVVNVSQTHRPIRLKHSFHYKLYDGTYRKAYTTRLLGEKILDRFGVRGKCILETFDLDDVEIESDPPQGYEVICKR
ncbi:MAG: hypothetical protein OXB88_00015 [Bacteriovoracales bacterium]|nr:hypothetical protein [Bacteriovoracales bacterium]